MRGAKSPEKTGFLEEMGVEVVENCDLMVPGSFDTALQGCDFVHHMASPFFFAAPDGNGMDGFVKPALEGTKNVLTAAKSAGTVRRVVLTSSCAAITWQNPKSHPEGEAHVWTEDDWQEDSSLENGPYRYSKRLAERAAWDFVKDGDTFDLVAINPAFVIGPVLNARADAQSIITMKSVLDGSMKKVGAISLGVIDVRDVAQAHVNAMFVPLIQGTGALNKHGEARFILSSSRSYSMLELVQMLHQRPDYFDSTKFAIPTEAVGPPTQNLRYKNDRARGVLGLTFKKPVRSMLDGAKSLLEHGVVKVPSKDSSEL